MTDILHLALDDPPHALRHGALLQLWSLRVRKNGTGADPVIRVDLYEAGEFRLTVIPETSVSAETVLEGRFDALTLAGTGESAEAYITVERGSGGASVDLNNLEWSAVMLLTDTTRVYDELALRWNTLSSISDALRFLWDVDSYLAPPVSRTFEVLLPERSLLTSSRERLVVGPRAPDVKVLPPQRTFR